MFEILFSMSSLITTTIISSVAIIVFVLVTNTQKKYFVPMKFFTFFLVFIIFRLLFPVEFKFATEIPSQLFLPAIYKILNLNIGFYNFTLKQILIAIWLIICVLKLITLVADYYRFTKTLNCLPLTTEYDEFICQIVGTKKKRRILTTKMPGISSPVVVGLINYIIILPDYRLSNEDIKYILLHELQHIKQYDLVVKIICELLSIIYWWNPIIRLLCKHSQITFEINTDLAVTKNFDEQEKLGYLNCLLKMAKYKTEKPDHFSLAFIKDDSDILKKRFAMVLESPHKSNLSKPVTSLLVALITVILSYSIVWEPYILPADISDESFELDAEVSYFLKVSEDQYDLYTNGIYQGRAMEQPDDGNNIPIYEENEVKQ